MFKLGNKNAGFIRSRYLLVRPAVKLPVELDNEKIYFIQNDERFVKIP